MTPHLKHAPPAVLAAFERLTTRQQAFALALPTAVSQEAAMLAAGYAPQTARKTAATLAAHPDVTIVVSFIAGSAIELARDSVDRLVQELCHIGLADPLGMFNDDDTLKPLREWPEELRRSLSSIDIDELMVGKGEERRVMGRTAKVRFWGKTDAIEKIAKIRGYLVPEKHEHVHRIEGMAGLLAEIDGKNTGPGPSSGP